MDAENLASTGMRSPESPARSESLYRLSYPGPQITMYSRQFKRCVAMLYDVAVPKASLRWVREVACKGEMENWTSGSLGPHTDEH